MKKLLAFLLAVIITVTVFTVSSAKEINTMSEDVRFSLEQETGDIKWLDGIKISSLYSADRVLLWENVFTPANGDIDSELSFIKTGVEYDLGDKFNGLSFDWYDNFCFRYEIPEWKWEEFPYTDEEWKNLFFAPDALERLSMRWYAP